MLYVTAFIVFLCQIVAEMISKNLILWVIVEKVQTKIFVPEF